MSLSNKILEELIRLADAFDSRGNIKLANNIDLIISKAQSDEPSELENLEFEPEHLDSTTHLDSATITEEDDLNFIDHDEEGNIVGSTSNLSVGTSPEAALIERLNIADMLMKDYPNSSGEEIAEQLGIEDQAVIDLIKKLVDRSSSGFYRNLYDLE